ncbi:putative proteasome endopeptidase complex [Helianthus annuus]|nr:putative proteasome endopeptidase complex [Helianthus annuus]
MFFLQVGPWYPYVTGTSISGIKYKDGILMAADMGGSYGSTIQYKSVERLKQVGKHSLIGASGELMYLDELIQKTQGTAIRCIKTPWVREARASGPKSPEKSQKAPFLALLVITLGAERKGPRVCVSCLFDTSCNYSRRGAKRRTLFKTKNRSTLPPLLLIISMIGVHYEDDHIATGFGNHLARPILREEWREDLSFEEGVKLLEKCMRDLLYRDRSAVNKLQIAKITEEGLTVSPPLLLFRIQQSLPWDHGSIFDLVLIYLSLCLNLLLGSDCKNTIYLSILLHNEISIHPSITLHIYVLFVSIYIPRQ